MHYLQIYSRLPRLLWLPIWLQIFRENNNPSLYSKILSSSDIIIDIGITYIGIPIYNISVIS